MADNNDFQRQLELEEKEKKSSQSSATNDPYTHIDPNDGTVYIWDHQKQAWFPKLDDDFIASYQSNYQYQETEELKGKEEPTAPNMVEQKQQKGEKRKANNDPAWFNVDESHNTNVYVTGLPSDTTEPEFIELMSKCGLIMKEPDTMKYKIKLYRNEDGSLKGDARCCYIKIESVGLALDIIDGSQFKGKVIKVERAQFEMKGSYDPSRKPRKRKNKEKEKIKKKLDQLFDWRPEKLKGMRSRNENTVIIKNMFDPKEFEEDPRLILDYQKDVREECSKCGEVKKVVVYDRHPAGVVSVTFVAPEMADSCISLMNKRWFAARQLTAETWDGKTKYKVLETEAEESKRISEWENYLSGQRKKDITATTSSQPVQSISATKPNGEKSKDNYTVTKQAYEMAGDTGSSGDSDSEVTNAVGPIIGASGTFTNFVRKESESGTS